MLNNTGRQWLTNLHCEKIPNVLDVYLYLLVGTVHYITAP